MARPRKRLDDDRIIQMMIAGKTIKEVAGDQKCSLPTAHKRMRELDGRVEAMRAGRRKEIIDARKKAEPVKLPDGEVLPEGATVDEINKWLKIAEDEALLAADEGNVDDHIKWVRLAATLLEAKRKAQPIPKQDPNENPDMVAAAEEAFAKLHKLVDSLSRVSNSPVCETIERLLHESTV